MHFFQARRDESRQAHDVDVLGLGARQDLVTGHHDAQIDDLEVVALQDHRDDVLADVVHVALDRGDDDLALGLDVLAGGGLLQLFLLDVGQQVRHGRLHDARRLDHLRQEHLALAEQVAHDVHAVHQRTFDHVQRAPALAQYLAVRLLGVLRDEFGDAVHQRVRKALPHRNGLLWRAAPFVPLAVVARRALGVLRDLHEALAGVGPAVQHHVFDALTQRRLQVVVHAHHAGVDDAHVHARGDRVVQEHRVDRLAHRVVAAEAERHVGDAARDPGAGEVLLDPARGLYEIHRVVVVLLDAGGHGEDVRVEDDVLGREVHLVHQDAVGALADVDLALEAVGLPLLVEGHHDGRGTVAAQQPGLVLELVNAGLHADRIHDRLALHAAQPGLDHLPFGRVDHDRHARDVGLAGDQVQEAHHRCLAVEHGLVHVHVDDLRAVFHLLARHGQGLLVLAVEDHASEHLGARDVGALADVDEQRLRVDAHGLEPGQKQGGNGGSFGHGSHLGVAGERG